MSSAVGRESGSDPVIFDPGDPPDKRSTSPRRYKISRDSATVLEAHKIADLALAEDIIATGIKTGQAAGELAETGRPKKCRRFRYFPRARLADLVVKSPAAA
jgi:hypothetical protein